VHILLIIFISLLYMFRQSICPSSGELTVSMRHWCWSAGWNSFQPADRTATHTEWQTPVSHRYSKFSWWWAYGCPKHKQKRNKYTKKYVHLVGSIYKWWNTSSCIFVPSYIHCKQPFRMILTMLYLLWNTNFRTFFHHLIYNNEFNELSVLMWKIRKAST